MKERTFIKKYEEWYNSILKKTVKNRTERKEMIEEAINKIRYYLGFQFFEELWESKMVTRNKGICQNCGKHSRLHDKRTGELRVVGICKGFKPTQ